MHQQAADASSNGLFAGRTDPRYVSPSRNHAKTTPSSKTDPTLSRTFAPLAPESTTERHDPNQILCLPVATRTTRPNKHSHGRHPVSIDSCRQRRPTRRRSNARAPRRREETSSGGRAQAARGSVIHDLHAAFRCVQLPAKDDIAFTRLIVAVHQTRVEACLAVPARPVV